MQEPIRSVTFSGFNQQEMGTWPTKMQLGQQTHGLNQVTNQVTLDNSKWVTTRIYKRAKLSTDRKDHDKKVQLLTLWLSELARFFNQPCNRCHVSFSLRVAGSETRDGTTWNNMFETENSCVWGTHAWAGGRNTHCDILWQVASDSFSFLLVVWTPLKNMKVSWDDYSQYMESHLKFMFQTTNQVSFHLAAVHFSPSATTWMFRIWLPVASMQVASSGMQMK